MAETSRSDDDAHTVLAATPARQGRYGRHMFWVLVFGTLLAAIGLALAWTWKAPSLARDDAKIARAHAQATGTVAPAPGSATTAPRPQDQTP